MKRSELREIIFKLVYEDTVRDDGDELSLKLYRKTVEEEEMQEIETTYRGIIANKKELLATIEKYSPLFVIDRIYKIDVAILMLAIYEIKNCDNVPQRVSINEAIELAKKYSTDKSPYFINGVLASVIKEINDAC